jgi:hypothetical protein
LDSKTSPTSLLHRLSLHDQYQYLVTSTAPSFTQPSSPPTPSIGKNVIDATTASLDGVLRGKEFVRQSKNMEVTAITAMFGTNQCESYWQSQQQTTGEYGETMFHKHFYMQSGPRASHYYYAAYHVGHEKHGHSVLRREKSSTDYTTAHSHSTSSSNTICSLNNALQPTSRPRRPLCLLQS